MRDPQASTRRRVIARTTHDPAATEALGEAVGRVLAGGDVLLLVGDLGSGKTTFVRGLARGLGVVFGVKSPTFAIHLRYPGRRVLHHLDLYRLEDARDLEELGLDDVLGSEGVAVVEWGERLGDLAPAQAITLRFEESGPSVRRIVVTGPPGQVARLAALGGWEEE